MRSLSDRDRERMRQYAQETSDIQAKIYLLQLLTHIDELENDISVLHWSFSIQRDALDGIQRQVNIATAHLQDVMK